MAEALAEEDRHIGAAQRVGDVAGRELCEGKAQAAVAQPLPGRPDHRTASAGDHQALKQPGLRAVGHPLIGHHAPGAERGLQLLDPRAAIPADRSHQLLVSIPALRD